jgi:excisionase family DNA binding protein
MRTIDNDLTGDQLVVSPRVACRLLDTGNTRLYELLAAGELDSYREGRSRKITIESIRRLVRRRLADELSATGKHAISETTSIKIVP